MSRTLQVTFLGCTILFNASIELRNSLTMTQLK